MVAAVAPITTAPRSRVAGVTLLLGLAAIAAIAPWWLQLDPSRMDHNPLLAPSAEHPFGTDDLGRDMLAGVVYGARTSLLIGAVTGALATAIGLIVGGVAAMKGGAVDLALMRATELVQALPRFFLIVLAVSLFGSSGTLIVLVIGLTTWPSTARLFRGLVLSVLARDFVSAARAAGCSDAGILLRHAFPFAVPVVAAEAAYTVGGAIVAEAGVGFLGLGDPSVISWGALLGHSQHFVREAWWMSVFPGLALTTTVLACNLIADSLVIDRSRPATAFTRP